MALFNFRDSWNVWRRKVDEALGTVEPIPASNVILDGSDVSVNSAIQQLTSTDENLENQVTGMIDNDFTNGAVNLLANNASTQTVNGVTFTVNSDKSITVNGTATANINYDINIEYAFDKKAILSGTPSNAPTNLFLYSYPVNTPSSGSSQKTDNGVGVLLDYPEANTLRIRIYMESGVVASNVVFKPMITIADMPNSDYEHYVPYAMSNRELTEKTKGIILAKIHSIEVTAENDTIDSLLVKLYDALLADKEAQPADYYHYVSGMTLTGYATLKNLASGIRAHSSGIAYNYFGARLPSANEMQITYIEHKASGNVVLKAKLLNDGTFTLANEKTNVLSDGTKFTASIEYYKQNK